MRRGREFWISTIAEFERSQLTQKSFAQRRGIALATLARAFGRSERTVRRYQRRFDDGGLVALGRPGGYPRGRPSLGHARTRLVSRLRGEGKSVRQIANRVGVSEKAIRKQLRRLGWPVRDPEQTTLALPGPVADPKLSGSAASADETIDVPGPAADPSCPDRRHRPTRPSTYPGRLRQILESGGLSST